MLRADRPLTVAYCVEERHERFEAVGAGPDGRVPHSSKTSRTVLDAATGQPLGEELVRRNRALVRSSRTRR